jgi:hypothetical protein
MSYCLRILKRSLQRRFSRNSKQRIVQKWIL